MATGRLAFIACIENNKIAPETLLLVESIRAFGGSFSESPIYTFNPRGLGQLKKSYSDRLRSLNVIHSDEVLNADFREYPPANKIYSAFRAEQLAKEDFLVFLDSDSVILNEPAAFRLPDTTTAAVSPVWAAGIGSHGPKDPAHRFWRVACEVCNVELEPQYVETRLTRERVLTYWNAGLVVVRRSACILSRWLDCFTRMASTPKLIRMLTCGAEGQSGYGPQFFLEQAALVIALMPFLSTVRVLGPEYNCPLHNRHLLQHAYPETRFDLDNVVHFHYNRSFREIGFLDSFDPPLNGNSPQYNWLKSRLPLEPSEAPSEKNGFVEVFEQQMKEWRNAVDQLS